MNRSSLSTLANAELVESAYQAWLQDHNSVDPTWRAFFQGFALASAGGSPAAALAAGAPADAAAPILDSLKQSRVHQLINAYRSIGHFQAHLDPLSDPPAPHPSTPTPDPLSIRSRSGRAPAGTIRGGSQPRGPCPMRAVKGGEKRSVGVGARSALCPLTRRRCLSAANRR